jgi:hypothetical protein
MCGEGNAYSLKIVITNRWTMHIKVIVILRPTVGRTFCPVFRPPSRTRDQIPFFVFLEIIFRQWSICYYGASSLTRGPVCNLQLVLGLASAVILGSVFRGTHTQFHCLEFGAPPIWRTRFPYLFPPGTRYVRKFLAFPIPAATCNLQIPGFIPTYHMTLLAGMLR